MHSHEVCEISVQICNLKNWTPVTFIGFHVFPRLFVYFVALRPKSTAMVIAGRSVHLITLFSWAGLNKRLTSNSCTYFRLLSVTSELLVNCLFKPAQEKSVIR